MLELCFSESAKGSLSLAQNCEKNFIGGAIGIITDKKGVFSFLAKRKALKQYQKRQTELQKQAVSLGGKKEDIIAISFDFSQGDIKAPILLEGCPRKDYIYSTFSFDRHNDSEDMQNAVNNFWKSSIQDLEKLKTCPEKIRIWLDDTPTAQCGLLFVADLLKNSDTEIHIVKLPKSITKNDCIIEYRAWGEVEPQLFGTFLKHEQILNRTETESLSSQWQALVNENAPLRIIKNGIVQSADESYYDDLIRKEFPKDICKIAHIVGNALGKQKIPTGDVFIAKRIQHFIACKELFVTQTGNNGFYSTIVKRDY